MGHPLRTTLAARFGGFAAGHILLSVCSCIAWIGVQMLFSPHLPDPELVPLPYLLLNVALLGAYFPIGAYAAARHLWPRPSGWLERILAVLLPALVAWLWEGFILVGLSGSAARSFGVTAIGLIPISFLLAFPSSVFVLFCTLFGFIWGWGFFLVAFLAGLLPPLLFAAGSFWQAWRTGQTQTPRGGTAGNAGDTLGNEGA